MIQLKDNIDRIEFLYIVLVLLNCLTGLSLLATAVYSDSTFFSILNTFAIIIDVFVLFYSLGLYIGVGLGFLRRKVMLVCLSLYFISITSIALPLGFAIFDTPDTVSALVGMGDVGFMLRFDGPLFNFYLFTNMLPILMLVVFLFYYKREELMAIQKREPSLLRVIIFFTGHAFALLIIIPIYLYMSSSYIISMVSRGFLQLNGLQLQSVERVYKKGNKKLSLIPMMHIGDKKFYKEVASRYNQENTLILREGVSDEKKVIKYDGSHNKISAILGLSSQVEELIVTKENKSKIIAADIDASEFSGDVLKTLNLILKVNESIDKPEKLVSEFIELDNLLKDVERRSNFYRELIIMRNKKLLNVFNKEGASFQNVIIPWGALHMPALEEDFKLLGYQLVESHKRTMVYFFKK